MSSRLKPHVFPFHILFCPVNLHYAFSTSSPLLLFSPLLTTLFPVRLFSHYLYINFYINLYVFSSHLLYNVYIICSRLISSLLVSSLLVSSLSLPPISSPFISSPLLFFLSGKVLGTVLVSRMTAFWSR